jgi:two-component system, sensor histidine kinase
MNGAAEERSVGGAIPVPMPAQRGRLMAADAVNVLAVDDRPDGLLALRAVLESPHYNVVTVPSGAEALAFLLEHECAVILLDVQMPVMDGFETARLIRSHRPSQDTPIIFITAISKGQTHMHRGYELGAVDYVFKPFDSQVLRSKVAVFAALYRNRRTIGRQTEQLAEVNRRLQLEVAERREAQERLANSEAQLKALSARLLTAQEEERRSIAQDLHDDLGQILTCIGMDLRRALHAKPKAAQEILQETAGTLHRAHDSLRLLATSLRPPILDGEGLGDALAHLVSEFEVRTGVRAKLEVGAGSSQLSILAMTNLYRIVQEALHNVQKHARAASVVVELAFPPEEITLAIRDDGCGCDPGSVRAGRTLGLVSMKERAELFGGEFRFASTPGGGAEVRVTLPRAGAAAGTSVPAPERSQPLAGAASLRSAPARLLRVVLADDHALVREGCARLLQESPGIQVVGEAADGTAAVELAIRERPDVLVLDYSMPGMDGAETTARVRAIVPGVKILVLTMHDSIALATRMLRLGADGYVVKTEAADALVQAVRAVADGKRHVSACTGIKTPPA